MGDRAEQQKRQNLFLITGSRRCGGDKSTRWGISKYSAGDPRPPTAGKAPTKPASDCGDKRSRVGYPPSESKEG